MSPGSTQAHDKEHYASVTQTAKFTSQAVISVPVANYLKQKTCHILSKSLKSWWALNWQNFSYLKEYVFMWPSKFIWAEKYSHVWLCCLTVLELKLCFDQITLHPENLSVIALNNRLLVTWDRQIFDLWGSVLSQLHWRFPVVCIDVSSNWRSEQNKLISWGLTFSPHIQLVPITVLRGTGTYNSFMCSTVLLLSIRLPSTLTCW